MMGGQEGKMPRPGKVAAWKMTPCRTGPCAAGSSCGAILGYAGLARGTHSGSRSGPRFGPRAGPRSQRGSRFQPPRFRLDRMAACA
jgi:hypothetical protein